MNKKNKYDFKEDYFNKDEFVNNNKDKEKRNNSRLLKIKFKDKSKNDYWMEEDF